MKRTALAVTVATAAALGLAGCGGSEGTAQAAAKTPSGLDVTVTFALHDDDTFDNGCEGTGGYSDIGSGAQVTLTNQSGDILAARSLGDHTRVGQVNICQWIFTLKNVPAGAKFYSLEVGNRGKITKSAADLKADDYQFEASLGS